MITGFFFPSYFLIESRIFRSSIGSTAPSHHSCVESRSQQPSVPAMEFGAASSRVLSSNHFLCLIPNPKKSQSQIDLPSLNLHLPSNASFQISSSISRRDCTFKATLKDTNTSTPTVHLSLSLPYFLK